MHFLAMSAKSPKTRAELNTDRLKLQQDHAKRWRNLPILNRFTTNLPFTRFTRMGLQQRTMRLRLRLSAVSCITVERT